MALSNILAHIPLNLSEIAERTAYGVVLALVLLLGFALAWLIQAARRNHAVSRLIEARNREQRADMEESRLLAEDMALEQANKLAQQARSIEALKARLAQHIARTRQEALAHGAQPAAHHGKHGAQPITDAPHKTRIQGVQPTADIPHETRTHGTQPSTDASHENRKHGAQPSADASHENRKHGAQPTADTPNENRAHGTQPVTNAPHEKPAHETQPVTGESRTPDAQHVVHTQHEPQTHSPQPDTAAVPATTPTLTAAATAPATASPTMHAELPHAAWQQASSADATPQTLQTPLTAPPAPASQMPDSLTGTHTTTITSPPSVTSYTSIMALQDEVPEGSSTGHTLTTADLARRAAIRANIRHAEQRARAARQAQAAQTAQADQGRQASQPSHRPDDTAFHAAPDGRADGAPTQQGARGPANAFLQDEHDPRGPLTRISASAEASYAELNESMRHTTAAISNLAQTLRVAGQASQMRRALLATQAAQAVQEQGRATSAPHPATGSAHTESTYHATGGDTPSTPSPAEMASGHAHSTTSMHGAASAHHVASANSAAHPHAAAATPADAGAPRGTSPTPAFDRHAFEVNALKQRLALELRNSREKARLLRNYEADLSRWREAHLQGETRRVSLQASVQALEAVLQETRRSWAESERELTRLRAQLRQQQAINLMSVRPAVDMSRLLATPEAVRPAGTGMPTLPMLLRDRLHHAAQTFRRRTGMTGGDAPRAS